MLEQDVLDSVTWKRLLGQHFQARLTWVVDPNSGE